MLLVTVLSVCVCSTQQWMRDTGCLQYNKAYYVGVMVCVSTTIYIFAKICFCYPTFIYSPNTIFVTLIKLYTFAVRVCGMPG